MGHARDHYLRETAAAAAAAAAASNPLALANVDELMLAQLHEDRRRLKNVESLAGKAELKRTLLPDYVPYVAGVLQADTNRPDEVLMTVFAWRIDAGDYRGALKIAEHALRHQLSLPDQFKRSTPCYLAEEIAEQALRGQDVPTEILIETDQMTVSYDMPDEARAKLAKAMGFAMRDSSPLEALEQFQRAVRLHDKAGVKKEIEQLNRQLKKTAEAAQALVNGENTAPPPATDKPKAEA